MRLFWLTALTMVAFAANSILNRLALVDGSIDPAVFGAVRLLAGAAVLWVLVAVRRDSPKGSADWRAAAALFAYVFGFSFAYLSLDAGLGALILFGLVQITMFGGALWAGERPSRQRWIGAILAFGGLAWLLWPTGAVSVSPLHAGLMAVAGVGWGVYSLLGRGAADPLKATGANFLLAAPFGLGLMFVVAPTGLWAAAPAGLALALVSGAITSGLGYALWYSVLPRLDAATAGIAQLTVPVIAVAGGVVLLDEPLTVPFVVATALVLGGVALATRRSG